MLLESDAESSGNLKKVLDFLDVSIIWPGSKKEQLVAFLDLVL